MEPIKRVPLVRQVEKEIRKLIEDESLAPGTKLPTEMELCKILNVGRGTVREAFRFLQAKGIVELKAGRGAFVADKKPETDPKAIDWLVQNEQDLRNVFQMRYAIEPVAARLAADRISEQQLEVLKEIHQKFVSLKEPSDAEKLGKLDMEFHSCIMLNCGNNLMIEVMNRINESLQEFRKNTFSVTQNIKDAVGPHNRILNALIAHDYEKAEREMRKHILLISTNLTLNISLVRDEDNPN